MIQESFIREWSEKAPWAKNEMVEQDLIICRALVSIFSDDFLRENLAFRGGTALHKLFLQPQARYSEDIDLVQIKPGPIKPIMFRLGEVLEWLPNRSTQQKRHSNKLLFKVESGWFTGVAQLTTYHLEELVGTKLRALYQRKKGRDLFDLYLALSMRELDAGKILECYRKCIEFVAERAPSYKEFVQNMEIKMQDEEFLEDVQPLLRSEISFDPLQAWPLVYERLVDRMPGKRD